MGTAFATILALLKAIPAIKALFEQFLAFYVQQEIANMKKENRDAIQTAITAHDQRGIETSVGNPNSGEPVEIPGGQIVDHVPGVDDPKPGVR